MLTGWVGWGLVAFYHPFTRTGLSYCYYGLFCEATNDVFSKSDYVASFGGPAGVSVGFRLPVGGVIEDQLY